MTYISKITTLLLALSLLAVWSITTYAVNAGDEIDEIDSFLNDILWETDEELAPTDTTDTKAVADTKEEKKDEDHDSAEEILDQIDDDKWAYAEDKISIQAQNMKETSVEFLTTKATYDNKDVAEYRIYFSEKTLATQKTNLIKDVVVKSKPSSDKNKVVLTLDNLKPQTKYFVVVSPIHPTDPTNEPLTMITDETSFTTKSTAPAPAPAKEEVPADDNAAASGNTAPAPAVPAGPKPTDKIFNSVAYTTTNNNVTITRDNKTTGIDKVEVSLRHQGESSYTNLGAPKFSAGKYSFNVDKSGNYFLKLKGQDTKNAYVGKEHVQTIKVTEVKTPTQNDQPVVTNAPKVGPTTDLLIGLLIFSMVVYMMYRFRRID